MSTIIESAYLWNNSAGHDKVYTIRLTEADSSHRPGEILTEYKVTAEYGARLGVLKTITKLKTDRLSEAKNYFNILVDEKLNKGYDFVDIKTKKAKKDFFDKPPKIEPGLERRIDFEL